MPVSSKIPTATVTGDAVVDDDGDEVDAPETDQEEPRDHKEAVFEELEDLEGDWV